MLVSLLYQFLFIEGLFLYRGVERQARRNAGNQLPQQRCQPKASELYAGHIKTSCRVLLY